MNRSKDRDPGSSVVTDILRELERIVSVGNDQPMIREQEMWNRKRDTNRVMKHRKKQDNNRVISLDIGLDPLIILPSNQDIMVISRYITEKKSQVCTATQEYRVSSM